MYFFFKITFEICPKGICLGTQKQYYILLVETKGKTDKAFRHTLGHKKEWKVLASSQESNLLFITEGRGTDVLKVWCTGL